MCLESFENRVKSIPRIKTKGLIRIFSDEKDIFLKKIILLQIIKNEKIVSLEHLSTFLPNVFVMDLKKILICSLSF